MIVFLYYYSQCSFFVTPPFLKLLLRKIFHIIESALKLYLINTPPTLLHLSWPLPRLMSAAPPSIRMNFSNQITSIIPRMLFASIISHYEIHKKFMYHVLVMVDLNRNKSQSSFSYNKIIFQHLLHLLSNVYTKTENDM